MTTAGLRYFSVYQGYGGSEGHKGEYANVIAQFAEDIANGDSPEVYGDGHQTRDFTHVDDIVRATILAADHEIQGIYNVGTGEQHSFRRVVELINAELGTDVQPTFVENPLDVYVHDTLADYSKFQEATGWEPEIDLETGIKRVCSEYVE
ncbi:MAG: NAD dependent epimerase/dehydratase family protein [halophilic archaeon J07HB67]|jgi:Nucleoside-diphosphate-sugar epimerases|nr:MAG: NAD dependent epimerase/dehydratase family protein [halophilic archaeon J07HB67]